MFIKLLFSRRRSAALVLALALLALGPAREVLAQAGTVPAQTRLTTIRERGHILLGVRDNLPPFGSLNERTGQLEGFDVDICRELAKRLSIRPVFTPLTAHDVVDVLATGNVDAACAALSRNAEDAEAIDYSLAYFRDGQTILAPTNASIASFEDLLGKRVAGVAAEPYLNRLASHLGGAAGAEPFTPVTADSPAQAFLAVLNGEADAMTGMHTALLALRKVAPDPEQFSVTGELLTPTGYAVGLPEYASDLRDAVDNALMRMWEDGSYMEIWGRHFGPETGQPLPLTYEMDVLPRQ